MSLLAVLLPPRDRLGRRGADSDTAVLRLPAEWVWALSDDGRSVTMTGQSAAALLPRADRLVLVLAEADVSWHRVPVPKAPASRLRAALGGVLEEHLLADDDTLHLAMGPGAAPGREGWVAATDSRWLGAALAAFEAAGRHVDAAVPGCAPGDPRGHFHVGGDFDGATVAEDDHPWLSLADADGVWTLRVSGDFVRARLGLEARVDAVRWSASPAAAAAAERLLGRPVRLVGDGERALEAAQSELNLLQFELAPRHRGSRALRGLGQRLLSREWRAVRWGLGALVLAQLAGLNAYAWQQQRTLAERRQAMTTVLKTAHPGVQAVLDAPVQMQRETERLRSAAGRPGAGDFEALLGAAATAWPEGLGPTPTLRFEPGSLTLAAPGWAEPQVQQFREGLRGLGYGAQFAEGRVVVTPLRTGSAGATR